MNIKTRFAPSPTGALHIGNIRTALYSWLFARKMGGKFLLRIEDSDVKRSTTDSIDSIILAMRWLKLDWDEGPYFQTHRFNRYDSIINSMINNNIAYKCYCSSDRLQSLRRKQIKNKEKPRYDGFCRIKKYIISKNFCVKSYVVRFCNPKQGRVTFFDQIRGFITFDNQELDDVIIRRVDGSPTYNFCVVVDDMDMNITHVIRGEEHINNTPRQINILKALNAPIPIYTHVSTIVDINRKKISKRHGSINIMKYRYDGFLPESLLNYLVKLGWSHGDQEIFSIDEMKQYFDLKKISKSSSIFDINKLLWMNHYYINHSPIDYVASHLDWYMNYRKIDIKGGPYLIDMVKLFKKRSYTLKEMLDNCYYFYKDINRSDEKTIEKYLKSTAVTPLLLVQKKLNDIINWTPESIKSLMSTLLCELNISFNELGMPLRVALTGTDRSPELSNTIYLIGRHRTLKRINDAIQYIYHNDKYQNE